MDTDDFVSEQNHPNAAQKQDLEDLLKKHEKLIDKILGVSHTRRFTLSRMKMQNLCIPALTLCQNTLEGF